ncbi:MAG: ADP-forming succinate--CoA ligase subunit beta [Deltaproteobacteria bacterium]|nr:ADP-forming succinate--CoA ligase subunit beta [Deltaproteobacteria bacterium]
MKIHEYQAKELLQRYGVPIPAGRMATTAEHAQDIARGLGRLPVVVKAQIHAGGRGKGGGVKLCRSLDEVFARASEMLGMVLKTHQTGPEGREVRRLLVEEGVDIECELYAGLVLDRAQGRVVFMMSSEGGVDIEEVAEKTPEKIHKVVVDPVTGLMPYQVRKLVFACGLRPEMVGKAVKLCRGLYDAYTATDASILECNPLIVTRDGDFLALDAKMVFDDNALYRHPSLNELRDLDEEDPKEVEAKVYDLSYIALDGNIGCLVNGAGLAMATMDIIKQSGGEPANFLDVGGGATVEKVKAAFSILLRDPKVEAVLVNIFGGIMKCDVIAEGIIRAAREVELTLPLVVRLEGTNVEEGKALLSASDIDVVSADNMIDAAQKVVRLAAERRAAMATATATANAKAKE